MERITMTVLAWIFALTALFLVLYYWVGLREIIRAGTGGITSILATLQGQVLPGRAFPAQFPN